MTDPDLVNRKFQKELNAGTTALVLLALLAQKGEALYGYEIAKQLASVDPELALGKQGALYPVLRSLADDGLLESWVEPSVAGPPRRYYRITPLGRRTLGDWSHLWRRTRRLIEDIVENGTSEGRTP
jgi:PadR family transcriptional regulator PadR